MRASARTSFLLLCSVVRWIELDTTLRDPCRALMLGRIRSGTAAGQHETHVRHRRTDSDRRTHSTRAPLSARLSAIAQARARRTCRRGAPSTTTKPPPPKPAWPPLPPSCSPKRPTSARATCSFSCEKVRPSDEGRTDGPVAAGRARGRSHLPSGHARAPATPLLVGRHRQVRRSVAARMSRHAARTC